MRPYCYGFVTMLGLLFGALVTADQGPVPPPGAMPNEGAYEGKKDRRGKHQKRNFDQAVLQRLAEHAPERHKELMALKEEDPKAYRKTMKQYAKRFARQQRHGVDNIMDEGAVERKQHHDRVGRMMKAPKVQEKLEAFKQENPEEFERLMTLRQENPEAFRGELRKLMKKKHNDKGLRQKEQQSVELAKQFHAAKTDEEKAAIRQQLETVVGELFDLRLEQKEKWAASLEKKLTDMQQKIAERRESKDAICSKRIEYLLQSPKLRWD